MTESQHLFVSCIAKILAPLTEPVTANFLAKQLKDQGICKLAPAVEPWVQNIFRVAGYSFFMVSLSIVQCETWSTDPFMCAFYMHVISCHEMDTRPNAAFTTPSDRSCSSHTCGTMHTRHWTIPATAHTMEWRKSKLETLTAPDQRLAQFISMDKLCRWPKTTKDKPF